MVRIRLLQATPEIDAASSLDHGLRSPALTTLLHMLSRAASLPSRKSSDGAMLSIAGHWPP